MSRRAPRMAAEMSEASPAPGRIGAGNGERGTERLNWELKVIPNSQFPVPSSQFALSPPSSTILAPIWALLVALALLAALAAPILAGEAAPPREDPPAREIYVPRADWDQVIAREGRGVMLRYREILELARLADARLRGEAPPVAAAIEAARYRGELGESAARFEATFTVRVLPGARPGAEAVELPLGLGGAGAASATLDGKPAPIRVDEGGSLRVVLPAEPAGVRTLVVRFSAPLARRTELMRKQERVGSVPSPEGSAIRELAFDVPPAPAARLDLVLPDSLEAAPEPALFERKVLPDAQAQLTVALGGAARFALSVRPKEEGRRGAPYASAFTTAYVALAEGRARVVATASLEVFRAPLPEVVLELPEGASLLEVKAPDLVRFSVAGRRVRVERARPNEGRFSVTIVYEQPAGEDGRVDLRPLGVARADHISGLVGIDAPPALRARLEVAEGVTELPASASPEVFEPGAAAAGGHLRRAFRHPGPAWRLAVRPEAALVRAGARLSAVVTLEEREMRLDATIAADVSEGRLFRLAAALPAGLEPGAVSLAGRAPGTWDWRIQAAAGGGRTLEVELREPVPAGASIELSLTGRAPLPAPGALREVGRVDLPIPAPQGFERVGGVVAVRVDPAYKLSSVALRGLDPLDAREADGTARGAAVAWRVVAADAAATLALRRESPRIDATIVARATVASGRISVKQEVVLDVSRAPIDELALLAPRGAGAFLHVEGALVKEHEVEDAGPLGDRIRVRLQGEQRGTFVLFADADARTEEWVVTGTAEALLPLVRVERAARDDGYAVVLAGDATEIAVRPADMVPVDAAEVPAPSRGPAEGRTLFAFRSALPSRSLRLGLTRHGDEALLTAAVAAARIVTAVDPLGRTRTQARFDVRNAQNQAIGLRLPSGSTLLSALVDGEGAKPARTGRGETYLVPLDEAALSKPAIGIEVVYETPHAPWKDGGRYAAEAPAVLVGGGEVPVLASRWMLHLPPGWRYDAFGGTARHVDGHGAAPLLVRYAREEPFAVAMLGALAVLAIGAAAAGAAIWRSVTSRTLVVGAIAVAVPAVFFLLFFLSARGTRYSRGLIPSEEMVEGAAPRLASAPPPLAAANGPQIIHGSPIRDEERAEHDKESGRARDAKDGSKAGTAGEAAAGKPFVGGMVEGLKSLEIPLPTSPVIEVFDVPTAGPATVEIGHAEGSAAARSAAFFAVLGLLLTLVMLRLRAGSEWRWLLGYVAAVSLGGAALGPAWTPAADGLLAGGLMAGAVRLLANLVRRAQHRITPGLSSSSVSTWIVAAMLGTLLATAGPAAAEEGRPALPDGLRIYVPYDPEHPSRVGLDADVFLPHEEFLRLWNAAHVLGAPLPAGPVDAFVASAAYAGRVSATEATIEATLVIRILRPGTLQIPLGLAGAAIESATLDGAPAAIEPAKDGVAAIVRAERKEGRIVPEEATLVLRFHTPVRERALLVPVVAAGAARLALDADAGGYDVEVLTAQGAVRSTDLGGGRRRIEADLGASPFLALRLVAPVVGGSGGAIEASADTATRVVLEAGRATIEVAATFRVAGGRADRFRLAIPAGVEPFAVDGAAVRGWRIVEDGAARVLEILAQEPEAELSARVRAEGALTGATFPVEGLPALGVLQERGTIAVFHAEGLRPVVTGRAGLVQIDAGSVPPAPEGARATLGAFRFTARPAQLDLVLAPVAAKLAADEAILLRVEDRRLLATLTLDLAPEGRPLFEAAIGLPEGFVLESAVAEGGAPAVEAPAVPGAGRTLRIFFPDGRRARTQVKVEIARPLGAEETALALPFFPVAGADRASGEVLLATGPDAEASVIEATALEPIDPAHARRVSAPAGSLARLAWRIGEGRPAARVALKRLAAELAATAVVATTIYADLVEGAADLEIAVARGGLDRIEVELPAWVGDGASFAGEGLREVSSVEAPSARFAGGRARVYTLAFQSPIRGSRRIAASFERSETAGGPVELPALYVRGSVGGKLFLLARTDGQANARLEPVSAAGAEPAAREDLPAFAAAAQTGGPDYVVSFLARGDPRVLVRRATLAQREQIEAIVDTADLLTLVGPTGVERTRARYTIQNRSEQFLEARLPAGATLWSCFVAGEPAKPVRKAVAGELRTLVPLPKRGRGELAFEVEIIFERQGERGLGWGGRVRPAAPDVLNMRISQTFWTVRLPDDVTTFLVEGNLEETVEAVKERQIYEKELESLKALVSYATVGSETEQQKALLNFSDQLARVEIQRQRASLAQTEAVDRLRAGLDEHANVEKLKKQIDENGAALGDLRAEQGKLVEEFSTNERRKAERNAEKKAVEQAQQPQQRPAEQDDAQSYDALARSRGRLGRQQRLKENLGEAREGPAAAPQGGDTVPGLRGAGDLAPAGPTTPGPSDAAGGAPAAGTGGAGQAGGAGGHAGKKVEAGRLSLRLTLPETGRAYHFRKPEGKPDLSFRAATLELAWAQGPVRLLALVLLFVAFSSLGLGAATLPGRAGLFRRSLGALATVGLALLAAASVKGAVVVCLLAGGIAIWLRRRTAAG